MVLPSWRTPVIKYGSSESCCDQGTEDLSGRATPVSKTDLLFGPVMVHTVLGRTTEVAAGVSTADTHLVKIRMSSAIAPVSSDGTGDFGGGKRGSREVCSYMLSHILRRTGVPCGSRPISQSRGLPP